MTEMVVTGAEVVGVAVAPSGVGHVVAIAEVLSVRPAVVREAPQTVPTAPERWCGRWRLVRQPDGLYARFSGVVDAFTDAGMDHDAAMACCMEENGCRVNEAEHRIYGAHRDAARWDAGPSGSGLDRWRESLEAMVASRGREWAARHLEEIGFGGWPVPGADRAPPRGGLTPCEAAQTI